MFWTIFWPVLAATFTTFALSESLRFGFIYLQTRKHNKKVKEFEDRIKAQLIAQGVDPSQIELMEMIGPPPAQFFNTSINPPVSGGEAISADQKDYSSEGYV